MEDKRKAGRPYLFLFGAIFVLFIGILVVTWRISRHTTVVMLDEQGKVVAR